MVAAANITPIETEPQPIPSKATLYAKLARVTGKVQRIEKNGWNDFHKYEYATASDVYDGVRAALAEENVAFIVDMVSAVHEGKRTRLEFDFTFACGDTGAVKVCRWVSESDDNADKGINKASTFAVKYFLIATFLIATGDIKDDPDADAPVPEKKAQPKKQERRLDTTEKPAPNGKRVSLRQQLMERVKHPYYSNPTHLGNALSKLFEADVLNDSVSVDKAVKLVEALANHRENGIEPAEAIEKVRQFANELAAAPRSIDDTDLDKIFADADKSAAPSGEEA